MTPHRRGWVVWWAVVAVGLLLLPDVRDALGRLLQLGDWVLYGN